MIAEHLKRDLCKLSYDRTIESLDRMARNFGLNSETLCISASGSMRAAFLTLYAGFRLSNKNVTAQIVLDAWVEAMRPELEKMDADFLSAKSQVESEMGAFND